MDEFKHDAERADEVKGVVLEVKEHGVGGLVDEHHLQRGLGGVQKKFLSYVQCHQKTELEKAKATLLLAALPKSLPCWDKEMEEISIFVKDAICNDQCL
ncbi:unnamed protein product [Urochloa humidicola]